MNKLRSDAFSYSITKIQRTTLAPMLQIFSLCLGIVLLCSACTGEAPMTPMTAPATSAPTPAFPEIRFTHYTVGGISEEFTAVILFEAANSTFTAYQVAFLSCTCRDASANLYSVCYVELLNTRSTADEAAIRAISFSGNAGLWGDSNPNHNLPEMTEEFFDEVFVQQLVRLPKREFDAWGGYGDQLDVLDVDTLTGATVSTANITSLLKSLFAYHAAKYYP